MSDTTAYRVRLRVFLGTPLATDDPLLTAEVAGREVTIRSHKRGGLLKETRWVVLGAGGFETEEEARRYGEQLRQIVEVAALCARLGVNVGQDRATLDMSYEWARATRIIQADDERLLPNVHGLMVIPDDDLSRFPIVEATAEVRTYPDQIIPAINELGRQEPVRIARAAAGVRTLNQALMTPGSLAQIVLALSAVEALGQDETWTARQRALLDELANQVGGQAGGDQEQQEVAQALRRSMHRIGPRQGVMRVLSRLELPQPELAQLRKEWDRVYSLRSQVFHGTAHLTDAEAGELAQAAITLCTRIVLAVATREGLQVPTVAETHFGRVP